MVALVWHARLLTPLVCVRAPASGGIRDPSWEFCWGKGGREWRRGLSSSFCAWWETSSIYLDLHTCPKKYGPRSQNRQYGQYRVHYFGYFGGPGRGRWPWLAALRALWLEPYPEGPSTQYLRSLVPKTIEYGFWNQKPSTSWGRSKLSVGGAWRASNHEGPRVYSQHGRILPITAREAWIPDPHPPGTLPHSGFTCALMVTTRLIKSVWFFSDSVHPWGVHNLPRPYQQSREGWNKRRVLWASLVVSGDLTKTHSQLCGNPVIRHNSPHGSYFGLQGQGQGCARMAGRKRSTTPYPSETKNRNRTLFWLSGRVPDDEEQAAVYKLLLGPGSRGRDHKVLGCGVHACLLRPSWSGAFQKSGP